MVNKA